MLELPAPCDESSVSLLHPLPLAGVSRGVQWRDGGVRLRRHWRGARRGAKAPHLASDARGERQQK